MRVQISINGMLAVHAKHAVFTALSSVEGITHLEIELGRVLLDHDGRATEAALRAAISAAGYDVAAITSSSRVLPNL